MQYVDKKPIPRKTIKLKKKFSQNVSKIYERIIYNQITLFSKFQCGFRKGFNAQHCLLLMIEKWLKVLDNGGETGAVLRDLFKTFDRIKRNLLIVNYLM